MKHCTPVLILSFSVALLFSCNNNNSDHSANANPDQKNTDSTSKQVIKKTPPPRLSLGTIDSGGRTDYHIATPQGWTKKTDTVVSGGRFVRLVAPLENNADKFPENINVITEKLLKPDLASYYQSGKKGMLRNMPGVIFQGEGDTVINKIPAKWLKCIFAGKDYVTYKVLMYLLTKNGYGYVITCTSVDPGFDNYEKVFKAAAGSFKIDE